MRQDLTVIDAIPERSPDASLLPSGLNVLCPRISPHHERGEKNHLRYQASGIRTTTEQEAGNYLYASRKRCQAVGYIVLCPVLGG